MGIQVKESFGEDFRSYLADILVLDYGCGYGQTVVAIAKMGARLAIGVDIRKGCLEDGRRLAHEWNLGDKCTFISAGDPTDFLPFYGQVDMVLRSLYRSDGARKFEEVEGGLNRMTIRRFEHLIKTQGSS